MSPSHTFCAGCGQHLELSYLHGVEHWAALAAEKEAARMVAIKESFMFVASNAKFFCLWASNAKFFHCDGL